jgi:hypothetical protein
MKKTLTTYEVANELLADDNADWTRSGALALAEHLEQLEEDCGVEFELDVVELRCEYTEYSSLLKCAEYYLTAERIAEVLEDSEDNDETLREYIHDHGQLIEFDGGIIVSNF